MATTSVVMWGKNSLERFAGWLLNHPRRAFALLLGLSSLAIIVNTLYAFVTQMLHGDIVAQQLIVSQWLSGVTPDRATLGPTNYLLKFPFYFFIEGFFEWIPPLLRLIGTALLFNVMGWLLIVVFSYKFLLLVHATRAQQVMLGWLLLFISVIAGNVFWLTYPNSRNIEVGLMLVALYWVVKLYLSHSKSVWQAFVCSLFLGVIFVNDQYALFAVALPAGLFFVWKTMQALVKSDAAQKMQALYAGLVLAVGAVVYFVLSWLVTTFTPVVLISKKTQTVPTPSQLWDNAVAVSEGVARTVGMHAPVGAPNIRVAVFYLASLLAAAYVLYVFVRDRDKRAQDPAPVLVWVATGIMLIATAASLVDQRYMIIVPFVLALYVAMRVRTTRLTLAAIGIVVLLSGVTLVLAILPMTARGVAHRQWHETSREVFAIIGVAKETGVTKGYLTQLHAQVVGYVSNGEIVGVPLACRNQHDPAKIRAFSLALLLERSTAFAKVDRVFVYVEKHGSCDGALTKDLIIKQIGNPSYTIYETPDGFMIIYNEDIRSKLLANP